jgi:hypothetical protein
MKSFYSTLGVVFIIAIIAIVSALVLPNFLRTYHREQAINLMRTYNSGSTKEQKYAIIKNASDLTTPQISPTSAAAGDYAICTSLLLSIEDAAEIAKASGHSEGSEPLWDKTLALIAEFKKASCLNKY